MNTQSKTHSTFIKEFSKIYKKSDWMTQEDFTPLYELFKIDWEGNELFIADELEKYSIVKWNEYLSHYHRVMWFILYLWNNISFKNDKIIVTLKWILEYIANSELPEKYGFTLKILFSINKDDSAYYINEYIKLKDEWKLYHDINEEFLEIFITIKSNELFLESFQQNIIDNATHVYYYSLEKWFRYLLSLDNENFQSIILWLFRFFDTKENKYKLIHYHEYNSLIRTYDKDDFKDILTALWDKILSSWFTNSQIKEIKNFIINDIDFAIERHERKLSEILFIDSLFQTFYHQDKSFLLDVLRSIKTKHIALSIETFIIEYLDISQIEDLIQIYKWWENEMVLYFVYDKFTYLKKEEFITALDNSSMKKEFKKRNKIVLKNQEKYKKKEENRRLKEKAELLMMLNPGKDKYYPKLFQDYVAYIKKEWWLLSLFTQTEVQRINVSIQEQIITYLEGINIKNYTDPKIQKILTFEKKENNSYTHTWNSAYLWWILDIAKNIQFDLSKYYNCYVLFFPLLWWSEKIKDTLEIISGHIGKWDIDFIIKAYTEDLHENAKDLRYFHIDSITEFYQKFKNEFNKPQKKRLMELSLNVINWDEESNIYVKDNFLKIYSEIWWEKMLKKLFHAWLLKYSHYNYFNDVLDNSETKKEEADKKKFIMFIARELCRTYSSRFTALWAIEQVRNWRIEVVDTHQIVYPNTFSTFSGISEKESEFRWSSDNDSFAYIFWLLSNINILDEILTLLDYSFQIQKELYSWDLKWDYESYCFYIRNIFYKYIFNLNKKYLEKDLYYEIKKILSKYDYKITYSFDLAKYKNIFWIKDIEEEAEELINTKNYKRIKELFRTEEYQAGLVLEIEKLKEALNIYKSLFEISKYIDMDCVIIVEGRSDKILLDWYFNMLREQGQSNLTPLIVVANNCRGVKSYLESQIWTHITKPIIGLFDFDKEWVEAFMELNERNYTKLDRSHYECRTKKYKESDIYWALLPVPRDWEIKNQVIKNIGSGKWSIKQWEEINMEDTDFWIESKLVIEHLFHDVLKTINQTDNKILNEYLFENETTIWWWKYIKLKICSVKTDFAEKIISKTFFNNSTYWDELFVNFKPILNLIEDIVNWKYKNLK